VISPDGRGLLTAYMAHHYGAGWRLHTLPDLQAAEAEAYGQFRARLRSRRPGTCCCRSARTTSSRPGG